MAGPRDSDQGASRTKRRRRRHGRKGRHAVPMAERGNADAGAGAPPAGTGRTRGRRGDGARGPGPVYAALDLGTNNCRLLVARPSPDGFRVIDAFSRIIRLGEGLSASGRLGDAAVARAIESLKVCTDKMAYRGVTRMRAIATEACRQAANATDFIARVQHETGLRLEIVDRRTEARLAVSGCASLLDDDSDGALIFDIGGGSSEIVWLDLVAGAKRCPLEAPKSIGAWTSLNAGVVTLAEKFGGVDVGRDLFEAMVVEVRVLLAAFEAEHRLSQRMSGRRVHMLGTSGTVTTIAGVHLALPRYQRARVDGCWLSDDEVQGVTEQLVAMSYAERVANPCIGSERADLVLAGCAILEAIRREWPCARLRVADRGLREGILATLMAEDGQWTATHVAPPREAPAGAVPAQAAGLLEGS